MRHIASLVAGIILAPVVWLLIGAGTMGLDPNGQYQDVAGNPSTAVALAMFAGAGILVGLLAVTRMSPAGSIAMAAVIGGAFALYRFTSFHFSLPSGMESIKIPGDASMVAGDSGVVLVLAVLLLMTVFVPSRWRGKEQRDTDSIGESGNLSSSGFPKQERPDAIDPFAPSADSQNVSGSTLGAPVLDGAPGYDPTAPVQPFGAAAQQQQQPAAEQRSPYADEVYDSDQYGYDQSPDTPRYGEQPAYNDQRQYR